MAEVSSQRESSHLSAMAAVGFFLLGLVLFLPFLSINYELNGVNEAILLEAGGPEVFSPNHLLYRPLGALFYLGMQTYLGYTGLSLPILQVMTAVFSALALAIGFLTFLAISNSAPSAAIVTLGMAVTWSYWVPSTDAFYMPVALPFFMASVYFLLRATAHGGAGLDRFALASGIACALAILVWQGSVFLLPILGCGFYVLQPRRGRIDVALAGRHMALMLGAALLLAGSVYLAVGFFVQRVRTATDFMAWAIHHSGSDAPMWGRWGLDRIPALLQAEVASFIPLWQGLGLRRLLAGTLGGANLVGTAALVAFLVLCIATVVLAVDYLRSKDARRRLFFWLFAAAGVYWGFFLWWDPQPKWLVFPNFFVWCTIALVWMPAALPSRRVRLPLLGSLVIIIGLANFTRTIWPQRTQYGVMMRRAACVSQQMRGGDVLLATDWSWPGYVRYLYRQPVESLLYWQPDSEVNMGIIETLANDTKARGGRLIMLNDDSPEYLAWLQSNAILTSGQLARLIAEPAFSCEEARFVDVQGVTR